MNPDSQHLKYTEKYQKRKEISQSIHYDPLVERLTKNPKTKVKSLRNNKNLQRGTKSVKSLRLNNLENNSRRIPPKSPINLLKEPEEIEEGSKFFSTLF